MIAENSAEAYQKTFNTKRLDALRYKVFMAILNRPGMMDEEIAKAVGSPINSITGRVKELYDHGLIEFDNTTNQRNNTCRRSYPKGTLETIA